MVELQFMIHAISHTDPGGGGGGGGTAYNGLYGEAPPERGYLFLGWRYIKGWGFHELKHRKE